MTEQRRLTVPYGDGDAVRLTYNPEAAARAVPNLTVDDADTGIVAFLAAAIVVWDIIGEGDAPYPLTAEAINELPAELADTLARAITNDHKRRMGRRRRG